MLYRDFYLLSYRYFCIVIVLNCGMSIFNKRICYVMLCLCLAFLVEHRLVTGTQTQTDRHTQGHGIYHAEHSSALKIRRILLWNLNANFVTSITNILLGHHFTCQMSQMTVLELLTELTLQHVVFIEEMSWWFSNVQLAC